MAEARSLDALGALPVSGWRLGGIASDVDGGLVLTLLDPAAMKDPERWHREGARHVAFPEWSYVDAMRPCFVELDRFEVRDDRAWVDARLDRMPGDWFSPAERAAMRRAALLDRELELPVIELVAPTFLVTDGPLRGEH